MHERSPVALIAILLMAALVGLFSSCGSNKNTRDATRVWEAHVKAVRAGQEQIAKGFFTEESRAYLDFTPQLQDDYLNTKFTVIKAQDQQGYVKLQVLVEKDGKQSALFKYLVRQDGKYLLQYPFLIFARNWPTRETQHFIVHSLSFSEGLFKDSTGDSLSLDPLVLEEFYSKIKNLIGMDYPKRIDYYFCQNKEQSEQLTGQIGKLWTSIGSCAISTKRYDFAEITYALTRTQEKPIDLLYYGIAGYAELERCKVEKVNWRNVDFTTAEHFKKLGEHPILSLLKSKKAKGEAERQRFIGMFLIGSALIDYLVDKFGVVKFQDLYQNSRTSQEFEHRITAIYNINIESLEKELNKKYGKYFSEIEKWQNLRR